MTKPTFFEPGKTYIEAKPFTAPELLYLFRCVAVAEHPAKGERRAFGFLASVWPGTDWCSGARGPGDWAGGWNEYDDTDEEN